MADDDMDEVPNDGGEFAGPADMPQGLQGAWSILTNALRAPAWQQDAGRLALVPGKTHLHTLAPFLHGEYREGNLFVTCLLHPADKQESQRLSYDARAKTANILAHFVAKHAELLPSSMLPASASESKGSKRRATGTSTAVVVATPLHIDVHRRRQLIFCLMGGFPFGIANNVGWRVFLGEYDIPVVPRSTPHAGPLFI